MLDKTVFGFFNRCLAINKVLAKHGLFLKFFERHNVYRFIIKKKVQGKIEFTRNLPACVYETFNGCEIIRNDQSRKEKIDFKPINVVYEPSFDQAKPVVCNFTNHIHTAYKSNICAATEGIIYSFENGQIIDYQGNFKYQGDVPFSIYFGFETTTGDSVFFDSKMYVVSYCITCAFHSALNLDKIVIYRSFQQTPEEIYDLSHFKFEHAPFFDSITLKQFKDAASAVLSRQTCTSFAELFSSELKFTIDSLRDWFNRIIKPEFFELDCFKKTAWRKKYPVTKETTCAICDFPLSAEAENGWVEHVAKAEHSFLRNIYSESKVKSMEIPDIKNYKEILNCILDLHHHSETALHDGVINDEIRDFRLEDLCGAYETFSELRQDVEKIVVPKKHFSHKTHNFSENYYSFSLF